MITSHVFICPYIVHLQKKHIPIALMLITEKRGRKYVNETVYSSNNWSIISQNSCSKQTTHVDLPSMIHCLVIARSILYLCSLWSGIMLYFVLHMYIGFPTCTPTLPLQRRLSGWECQMPFFVCFLYIFFIFIYAFLAFNLYTLLHNLIFTIQWLLSPKRAAYYERNVIIFCHVPLKLCFELCWWNITPEPW